MMKLCNYSYRVEKPIKSVGACFDLTTCGGSTTRTDLQSDNCHKNTIVGDSLL